MQEPTRSPGPEQPGRAPFQGGVRGGPAVRFADVDDHLAIDGLGDLGLEPGEIEDTCPGLLLLTGLDGRSCVWAEDLLDRLPARGKSR